MTDKFKNYVDNIQENDIKSLIISPLIVLVITQILSIFLEMASFFITTFTSRIMYNPTDYDTLISGTSFSKFSSLYFTFTCYYIFSETKF